MYGNIKIYITILFNTTAICILFIFPEENKRNWHVLHIINMQDFFLYIFPILMPGDRMDIS